MSTPNSETTSSVCSSKTCHPKLSPAVRFSFTAFLYSTLIPRQLALSVNPLVFDKGIEGA